MTIYKELHTLQKKLQAPKNQRNSFGNYNYRSAEDIVEAVKPLIPTGYTLTLSDEIVNVGTANYIKAVVTLANDKDAISATGWAREAVTKKGMDDSQITGATSSYARKYALNGLLCIDDNKDADTDEYRRQAEEVKQKEKEAKATEFVDDYLKKVDAVTTKDELMELQIKNEKALSRIKADYPHLEKHVIKVTKEKKFDE